MLSFQKPNSMECGIACMTSIMDYLNKKTTREKIIDQIKYYEDIGTYVPQWGTFLLKNNVNARIIGFNPFLTYNNKSNTVTIEKNNIINYPKYDVDYKNCLKYFGEYLRHNGQIDIQIVTNNLIRDLLQSKHILLVTLSSRHIYGYTDQCMHFCILYGYKTKRNKEYIMMHDPDPLSDRTEHKLQEVSLDEVVFGINSIVSMSGDLGFILAIKCR